MGRSWRKNRFELGAEILNDASKLLQSTFRTSIHLPFTINKKRVISLPSWALRACAHQSNAVPYSIGTPYRLQIARRAIWLCNGVSRSAAHPHDTDLPPALSFTKIWNVIKMFVHLQPTLYALCLSHPIADEFHYHEWHQSPTPIREGQWLPTVTPDKGEQEVGKRATIYRKAFTHTLCSDVLKLRNFLIRSWTWQR